MKRRVRKIMGGLLLENETGKRIRVE